MMANELQQSLHARISGFSGGQVYQRAGWNTRGLALRACMLAIRRRRSHETGAQTLARIHRSDALLVRGAWGAGADSEDALKAQAKLAAVRARIAELTGRLGVELKERDALNARLREADLRITAERQRLDELNAAVLAADRHRKELRAEQSRTRNALDSERAALAAQVRAQYMLDAAMR